MRRFISIPCIAISSALFAGCTSLSNVAPGTALDVAVQEYGTPTQRCNQGDMALVNWSTQPMGYYAWTAEVNPQGIIVSMQQMLSDQGFNRLNLQDWDTEKVACWYGPPAVDEFANWQGTLYRTWSYRYKQGGAFNALMYLYFTPEGRLVHYHPGLDPLDTNDGFYDAL